MGPPPQTLADIDRVHAATRAVHEHQFAKEVRAQQGFFLKRPDGTELRLDEDVPVGVAINEAVELAKMFGGEDSGSFVNGILGKIASGKKETGEAPKKRRPAHQAKIIIRSSKKVSEESETEESSN